MRIDQDVATSPPGRGTDQPTAVIPYLAVIKGADALAFYTEVFGAEEVTRMEGDGRIMHSEFRIGKTTFYLADESPGLKVYSPLTLGGHAVSFDLEVADADVFVDHLAAHAVTVERPVSDGPGEGVRSGWVIDPYGHRWHLSSRTGARP